MSDCCCARLAGLYLLAGLAYAGTVTVATGIQVPESTSPLPATFDGLTGHLVPDSTVGSDSDGASTVWQVSPTGDLIVYATNPASLFDGVLLAAPFGSYGDDTAMSSLEGVGVPWGDLSNLCAGVTVYDSNGNPVTFASGTGTLDLGARGNYAIDGGDLLVGFTEPGEGGIAISAGDRLTDLLTEDPLALYVPESFLSGLAADGGDLANGDDWHPYVYSVGADL